MPVWSPSWDFWVGGEPPRVKTVPPYLSGTGTSLSQCTCLEHKLGLPGQVVSLQMSKKFHLASRHLTESVCLSGAQPGNSRMGDESPKGQGRSTLPHWHLTDCAPIWSPSWDFQWWVVSPPRVKAGLPCLTSTSGTSYIAQAGLKLSILLFQLCKCEVMKNVF